MIVNTIDKILVLLKYKFLDIFWFSFWIFLIGEMFLYSTEKLLGYPTVLRWYDMAWLSIVTVMCFLISYRLYVLMISSKISDEDR